MKNKIIKSETALNFSLAPIIIMFFIGVIFITIDITKDLGWFYTILAVLVMGWIIGWFIYGRILKGKEDEIENNDWN